MRVLLQRVAQAQVVVDHKAVGTINHGLLILLGVGQGDSEASADALAHKILKLRIFNDDGGKMNRSVREVGGELLVVSQFTLYADATRGNRPSYAKAAAPAEAKRLYEYFVQVLRAQGVKVETGVFAAHMDVSLVNDGPVTVWLEHPERA